MKADNAADFNLQGLMLSSNDTALLSKLDTGEQLMTANVMIIMLLGVESGDKYMKRIESLVSLYEMVYVSKGEVEGVLYILYRP